MTKICIVGSGSADDARLERDEMELMLLERMLAGVTGEDDLMSGVWSCALSLVVANVKVVIAVAVGTRRGVPFKVSVVQLFIG